MDLTHGSHVRSGSTKWSDVMEWISDVQELGAGEILLTSVDQDGTCLGPDLRLQNSAALITNIPLISCGGFLRVIRLKLHFKQHHYQP